jgi:uncharacterized protein YbcI
MRDPLSSPPTRTDPSSQLTRSLSSLWAQYSGDRPKGAHTEIRGNVVTVTMADAVGAFNQNMVAAQSHDTVAGTGKLTESAYKREAVQAVVRVTGQRVASFVSSHDRETDVATERFTLEPSLGRGAPRADRAAPGAETPPRRAGMSS